MGYEWHVFVSYRRTGNVRDWVHNHFYDMLRRALEDHLPQEPRIFLDRRIEVGTPWGDGLEQALLRSRLLVPIWNPPYFQSRWCLAEWRTMRAREVQLREAGMTAPLTYPIRFSDGDAFPAEARGIQQEMCFKQWNVPYPQFAESAAYLDLHEAVGQLAERLAARLAQAPPWREDWPVERPEPAAAGPSELPRL